MKHIFILAICVAVGSALIGSFLFQFFSPHTNSLDLEKKCVKIANAAYEIQLNYPTLELNEIPEDDKNTLVHLDELWFRDCVSNFSEEKIMDIAQRVQTDYFSGK